MTGQRFTAIALAGGTLEADFREAGYDVPNKAFLPVGGVAMITRVLRALRAAQHVENIRCVTSAQAIAAFPEAEQLCDAIVEPRHDLIASLLAGIEGLAPTQRVLVTATDLPLLDGAVVDAFAALANATPCDIGYGFVERSSHEGSYPDVRHTWVRLREGIFCGAGMSVMRVGATEQVNALLRKLTAARKSPLALAALFSYTLLFKAVIGTLSVAEVERRARELSGLECRGLLCSQPELAVNVDRLEDLRTVEGILARA
ncbi:MAG: nucleotidyltransferase family protein [Candidatus Eremiobacteraeota bacterium]|nr:nucleotidyltransferase family protein [Candidatus Eremiobacteraeota bacterium]